MSRPIRYALYVLAALAVVALIQLLIGSPAGAAITKRCTMSDPCTRKQADARLKAGDPRPGRLQGGSPRRIPVPATKARTAGVLRCSRYAPVQPYKSKLTKTKLFWTGFVADWCYRDDRVGSVRISATGDNYTLGNVVGYRTPQYGRPSEGHFPWRANRPRSGYSYRLQYNHEQCVPVIRVGPLCVTRVTWGYLELHSDGTASFDNDPPV